MTGLAWLDLVSAVVLGTALASACGFRVFVPPLVAAVSSWAGLVQLAPDFAWLGSPLAIGVLVVASVAEIVAYHVPWLDHALDVIGAPVAAIAGALLTGGLLGDADPVLRWALAAVAGGGTAMVVHGAMAAVRGLSTATTGGLANPVVAFVESVAALALAVLAVLVPALVVVAVAFGLLAVARRVRRMAGPAASESRPA